MTVRLSGKTLFLLCLKFSFYKVSRISFLLVRYVSVVYFKNISYWLVHIIYRKPFMLRIKCISEKLIYGKTLHIFTLYLSLACFSLNIFVPLGLSILSKLKVFWSDSKWLCQQHMTKIWIITTKYKLGFNWQ